MEAKTEKKKIKFFWHCNKGAIKRSEHLNYTPIYITGKNAYYYCVVNPDEIKNMNIGDIRTIKIYGKYKSFDEVALKKEIIGYRII